MAYAVIAVFVALVLLGLVQWSNIVRRRDGAADASGSAASGGG